MTLDRDQVTKFVIWFLIDVDLGCGSVISFSKLVHELLIFTSFVRERITFRSL